MKDDLAIEARYDRLSIRRGKAEVDVFPGEIRHLVTALGSLHHNYQQQADEGPSCTCAV